MFSSRVGWLVLGFCALLAAAAAGHAASRKSELTPAQIEENKRKAADELARLEQIVEGLKLVPSLGSIDGEQTGKRQALVVGNDSYEKLDPLQKAVGDARTIAETLKRLGFEVTLAENVDVDTFDDELNAFYGKLERGDVAFFFFAGHGVADQGTNYLLPVDIPVLGELERGRLQRKAIDANAIVHNITVRGVRLALVVLDACRDDPFRRGDTRSAVALGGLAKIVPTNGAFVIYSAGAGQTALDKLQTGDPDPNSVFTRKFSPILETPGLPIVEVAKRTQVEVRQLAAKVAHDQRPAYYDEVDGQFYFQPPRPKLFGIAIGVDEYAGVRQLLGAVNDAERVARALEAVGADEVVRIFDRDARRTFIDFAWRSLVEKAMPGDTIVLHYAGASGSMPAPAGSSESGGADEFLPLADTSWKEARAKRIELSSPSLISDDALTGWMELAAEKNVNVVLVTDGCHGGGMLDREFANVSFIGASSETQIVQEYDIGGRKHGS